MIIFGWKLSFAWYWRNAWIGARYSVNRRALYFNLVPFLSIRFASGYKEQWPDALIDTVCPPDKNRPVGSAIAEMEHDEALTEIGREFTERALNENLPELQPKLQGEEE